MGTFGSPLSKETRLHSTLKFELAAAQNRIAWSRSDLERGEWAIEARHLTWEVIDSEERLQALEVDRIWFTEEPLRAPWNEAAAEVAQASNDVAEASYWRTKTFFR